MNLAGDSPERMAGELVEVLARGEGVRVVRIDRRRFAAVTAVISPWNGR